MVEPLSTQKWVKIYMDKPRSNNRLGQIRKGKNNLSGEVNLPLGSPSRGINVKNTLKFICASGIIISGRK